MAYRSTSLLVSASDRGDFETVKRLLEQGEDVDQKDQNRECALFRASMRGHYQLVRLLLQYRANVNATNGLPNYSALMESCRDKHIEIAKLLLDHGAIVNMQGSNGWSALMISCKNGHTETAKLLLDHRANVNMQCIDGASALYISSQDEHTQTAKLLLDHGADINMQRNDGGSALMISSHNGHTQTTKLLLDHGANVNMQYNDGASALFISSQEGHTETAKLLLDHGANVNMQRNDGASALGISSQNGHIETVKLLLNHGADINLRHNSGRSAFMFSIQYGHPEIAKLISEHEARMTLMKLNLSALMSTCQGGDTEAARHLLQQGVDVNMQSTDEWSALMYAVQNGFVETVEMLIQHKADVNAHLKDGFSALMCASQYRHTEIVNILLRNGANVNALKNNGWSVLMSAALSGNVEIVKNLLTYRAQVNHQMNDGLSALMIACQNGHTEITKILLEHDANPRLQDRDGWNALLFAQCGGHDEIVGLLRSREKKTISVSQESKLSAAQTSITQATRTTGKSLQPPSPYYVPTPGPGSVDSGYASSWGVGPSPAPSWMSTPSPGSALSPAPSTGFSSSAGSEVYYPSSPAQPSPPPLKSPFPVKYVSFKQMSSSASIAQHTSHQDIAEHQIAETSVLVTNSEQLFSWDEYGLSLHIPENSLPNNLQQCSIHIKATIMGDYQLPQDTHLVSAVYWIECVPKRRFSQPLTLEIQHCGTQGELYFIKDDSKDHNEMFATIDGGVFPCNSSYGFIELNEFCRIGVGKKGSKEREYCASVYYQDKGTAVYNIHFVIMWNSNPHKKLICDYYQSQNATFGHDQRVEFKSNSISLDIPASGVSTKDQSWTITPASHPEIRKSDVDQFSEDKRIPSCQLIATCNRKQFTYLQHLVKLKGAKKPSDYFTVSCTQPAIRGSQNQQEEPGPSNPKRARMADDESSQPEVTSPPKFTTLLRELSSKVSADWEDVGIALELEQGQLSAIKSDHQQSKRCFREMLKLWLKQVNPRPSWSAIIEAIELLEHELLAEELKKKYCN